MGFEIPEFLGVIVQFILVKGHNYAFMGQTTDQIRNCGRYPRFSVVFRWDWRKSGLMAYGCLGKPGIPLASPGNFKPWGGP